MTDYSHFTVELSGVTHSPDAMMALAERLKTVALGLALEGYEVSLNIDPWRVAEHDDEEVEPS